MKYSNFYKTYGHSFNEYESSHAPRLDFLIEDLKLNTLTDVNIADMGCGLGFLYNRLLPSIQKNYYGFDAAEIINPPFQYKQVDLDNFIADEKDFFDVALCFETIEHLTNPYQCLLEIKNMLKNDGTLYLSIPHENTLHNTIYPGLIYPKENFIVFLSQLAYEVVDIRYHDKAFFQNVFILKNKDWSYSKMLWKKSEEIFQNVPPHISVNL